MDRTLCSDSELGWAGWALSWVKNVHLIFYFLGIPIMSWWLKTQEFKRGHLKLLFCSFPSPVSGRSLLVPILLPPKCPHIFLVPSFLSAQSSQWPLFSSSHSSPPKVPTLMGAHFSQVPTLPRRPEVNVLVLSTLPANLVLCLVFCWTRTCFPATTRPCSN